MPEQVARPNNPGGGGALDELPADGEGAAGLAALLAEDDADDRIRPNTEHALVA